MSSAEICDIPYQTELPWKKETSDEVEDFFEKRACYYDSQMYQIYNGPTITAKLLSALVSDKSKKVLDVAAGTGLVGKALSLEGFSNITALDRSKEMLKYSALKNVYSQLMCGAFENIVKTIPDKSYHVCVCVGAFMTAGFLDPSITMREMVRVVGTGGLIFLLVNGTELSEPECMGIRTGLENACDEVTRNGSCKCLQKSTFPKYLENCEGNVWIFKKQ